MFCFVLFMRAWTIDEGGARPIGTSSAITMERLKGSVLGVVLLGKSIPNLASISFMSLSRLVYRGMNIHLINDRELQDDRLHYSELFQYRFRG
jgi:hypothetical protein